MAASSEKATKLRAHPKMTVKNVLYWQSFRPFFVLSQDFMSRKMAFRFRLCFPEFASSSAAAAAAIAEFLIRCYFIWHAADGTDSIGAINWVDLLRFLIDLTMAKVDSGSRKKMIQSRRPLPSTPWWSRRMSTTINLFYEQFQPWNSRLGRKHKPLQTRQVTLVKLA